MNGALDGIGSAGVENDEVSDLLAELGSQQHMEEKDKLAGPAATNIANPAISSAAANDVDEMQARLNQLKNL